MASFHSYHLLVPICIVPCAFYLQEKEEERRGIKPEKKKEDKKDGKDAKDAKGKDGKASSGASAASSTGKDSGSAAAAGGRPRTESSSSKGGVGAPASPPPSTARRLPVLAGGGKDGGKPKDVIDAMFNAFAGGTSSELRQRREQRRSGVGAGVLASAAHVAATAGTAAAGGDGAAGGAGAAGAGGAGGVDGGPPKMTPRPPAYARRPRRSKAPGAMMTAEDASASSNPAVAAAMAL